MLGEDVTVLSSFYPGGHGELEHESYLCGWMDWDGREVTGKLHWDQAVVRRTYQQEVPFLFSSFLAFSLIPLQSLGSLSY